MAIWKSFGRRACVFCGRSDLKITNEHAWPNWMRELFPPGPTTVFGTRPAPQKPITIHPRADDMGVKVNAVCRPCNEGWMENLETEVRPFLTEMIRDGREVQLTREQLGALARWAVKTAMVFEFTNRAPPFYAFDQRNGIRHGAIPGATLVWAARYVGPTFMSTAVAKGLIHDVAVNGITTKQPGSALTISVGQFVVQVVSVKPPENVAGLWFPLPQQFKDHAVDLWPRADGDSMTWPPAATLDDTTLNAFMGRFAAEKS